MRRDQDTRAYKVRNVKRYTLLHYISTIYIICSYLYDWEKQRVGMISENTMYILIAI